MMPERSKMIALELLVPWSRARITLSMVLLLIN